MGNRRLRLFAAIAAFAVLTVLLAALNMNIGSVKAWSPDIVYKIRLPRLAASFTLGGALALSGFLLQSFFNNPIAGPFVLGISHGAKLAVALVMVATLANGVFVNAAGLIGAAFVGALAVTGFVLAFARAAPRSSMLIVCGVMVGYVCSAATDFVTAFADDASIVNLHNWSRGSFSGASWADARVMAAVTLVTALAAFALAKPLDAYRHGEAYAQSVGVNTRALRVSIVALSGMLCAVVTAYAGPISFVGIAAPHIVKGLLKTGKPLVVMPMCFWCGALFCMGCDLAARTLFAPVELAVGSVTAVVGAPIVLRVMLQRRRGAA